MAVTFTFSTRTVYRAQCGTCGKSHEATVKADLVDWCMDHSQEDTLSIELGAQLAGRVYTKVAGGTDHVAAAEDATSAGYQFYEFNGRIFAVAGYASLPDGWCDGVVHISDVPDA